MSLPIDDEGGEGVSVLAFPVTPPQTQACAWPVVYADCGGSCDVYEKWPEEERAAAQAWFEAQAIDLLWNWTNGVFGVCDIEVRPCREGCDGNAQWASTFWGRGPRFDPGFPRLGMGGRATGGFYPVLISGQWFNVTCGCLGACRCSPSGPSVISLPGPIVSISEVTIDGVVIDEGDYRLDSRRWLIRTDGQSWPGCQDMNAAPGSPNTFVVKYKRGVPVPVAGQSAAGRLACELARAACGDDECSLPENWQTLTRQGISLNADPNLDGSVRSGIWSIDEWVTSVNRPRSFASVRSVDLPNLR